MGYNNKYYKRHLDEYREWENSVGRDICCKLLPESILDLGCGVGSYLEGSVLSGCKEALGVELNFILAKPYFTNVISPFIIQGDVTKDLKLDRKFDCVISFEVGEHIFPDGTDGFINNLTQYSNDYIILTAAPPGQGGTGHINLRERYFWIEELRIKKFEYKKELVKIFREEWVKFGVAEYILKNLMVFRRVGNKDIKKQSLFESPKGRKTNKRRTICEIHRDIYDSLLINISDKYPYLFEEIVELLEESFLTGVKITQKLVKNKLNQKEIFHVEHSTDKAKEYRKERNRLLDLKKEMENIMERYGVSEDDKYRKLESTELKGEFLKFTEEQFKDYKYIANFIRDKVGVSLNRKNLKKTGIKPIEEYDKMTCWHGLGSKQYPDELAKFLVFIYNHRSEIKSYCEIGVAAGGTFFVVDSFLRAINEDMGDSIGIDVNNKCEKDFITYIYQNPKAKFLNIDSNRFEPEMVYDLCFIDANHSFNASSRDYKKMKDFSKYLSFHDIHLENGGVKDLWKTITDEKIEFLNEDIDFPNPVGIGVILS